MFFITPIIARPEGIARICSRTQFSPHPRGDGAVEWEIISPYFCFILQKVIILITEAVQKCGDTWIESLRIKEL
jgi:hypothetical protein